VTETATADSALRPFDKPFDRLRAVSKAEPLKAVSTVEPQAQDKLSNAEVTTTATTDTTSRVVTPEQRKRRLDDLRKSSQKDKTLDVNRARRDVS